MKKKENLGRVSLVFKRAIDRGNGKKGHGIRGEAQVERVRPRRTNPDLPDGRPIRQDLDAPVAVVGIHGHVVGDGEAGGHPAGLPRGD